ncbi:hypothetical protein H0H87_012837, partial [Tephrocybe sp. NHM501043]
MRPIPAWQQPTYFSSDQSKDGVTLENLFKHIYPNRHLDIELLPVQDLCKLAEAAKKYGAFM